MSRWKPGASERLQHAALHLYAERGFEATTVWDIAERAGVTERTFFRHFADKREVLFAGEGAFRATFVAGITNAPDDASTIELIIAALESGGSALQEHAGWDRAHARQQVIAASEALQEREQLKLATLSRVISAAVNQRGVDTVAARLAGEVVVTVFTTAYERWVSAENKYDLVALQHEGLKTLQMVLSVRASAEPG
jgi:AcrR family transcriptional regulator